MAIPKEYLGFESDRNRILSQRYGTRTILEVGGRCYNFPSKLEARWALYLQFLQEHGLIKEWTYQPIKWDFWQYGYRNKPYEYTPDFWILDDKQQELYHETKGYLRTYDISRMSRANKHYHVQFWLVMGRIPKRGKHSQVLARAYDKAYIHRVVDASEIFRSTKGLIDYPE